MLPQSISELERIRNECRTMVTRRAGLSGAAAIVPIPGIDLGADVTLLLEMIPAINARFGLAQNQLSGLDPKVKQFIFVTVTSVGSQLIGRAITQQTVMKVMKTLGVRMTTKTLTRWVPIVGQAAAASISFGAMKMIGNAHIEDCYKVARKVLEENPAGLPLPEMNGRAR